MAILLCGESATTQSSQRSILCYQNSPNHRYLMSLFMSAPFSNNSNSSLHGLDQLVFHVINVLVHHLATWILIVPRHDLLCPLLEGNCRMELRDELADFDVVKNHAMRFITQE